MVNKLKIILCIVLFCNCIIKAQTQKHETFLPIIAKLPNNIAEFVPKGYEVLDTTFGNLNLDKFQDLIMVLKSPKEDTLDSYENPRPLLILLGEKNGTYKRAFQNNNAVYCNNCGGIRFTRSLRIKIQV